jgi:hypothetical protein
MMAFDPVAPSWTAGVVAGLFYVLRLLDRRAKRLSPGTVEYLTEQLNKVNEGIESLKASNRHRRAEIEELGYQIRQINRKLDEQSA